MSRIIIFTSESIYSYVLLDNFLKDQHLSTCSIYVSKSLRRQKLLKFINDKLLNGFGPIYYTKRIYYNIKHNFSNKSLSNIAYKYGIPLKFISNVNDLHILNEVREQKPDIIISVYFDQIIKEDILKTPSFGILNIHPSLLPKYRGVKPVFWALKNNESKTGITIHCMDEGIDTGDIVGQRELIINPEDTVDSLMIKLSELGSELLLDTINDIDSGRHHTKKQKIGSGFYYSQPTKDDIAQFLKQNKKLY